MVTRAECDACDRAMNCALVRVGPSTVCDGRGVFAACDLAPGSYATAYPHVGFRARRTRSSCLDPGRVYGFCRVDGAILDGSPAALAAHRCPPKSACSCRRLGVANLANDALDADLTGRANNCEFVEFTDGVIYLRTSEKVAAGTELLVSYSLEYWIDAAKAKGSKIAGWAAAHVAARDAIQRAVGSRVRLGEFIRSPTWTGYTVEFVGPPECLCPPKEAGELFEVTFPEMGCRGCGTVFTGGP